jgi:hypothetical protein
VKATQDGFRHDAPKRLHRPAARCIRAKGEMRANIVVVAGVGRKHVAKMGFAEDHDVIETFPTDRADEPLYVTVLPWLARCDRSVPDAMAWSRRVTRAP